MNILCILFFFCALYILCCFISNGKTIWFIVLLCTLAPHIFVYPTILYDTSIFSCITSYLSTLSRFFRSFSRAFQKNIFRLTWKNKKFLCPAKNRPSRVAQTRTKLSSLVLEFSRVKDIIELVLFSYKFHVFSSVFSKYLVPQSPVLILVNCATVFSTSIAGVHECLPHIHVISRLAFDFLVAPLPYFLVYTYILGKSALSILYFVSRFL